MCLESSICRLGCLVVEVFFEFGSWEKSCWQVSICWQCGPVERDGDGASLWPHSLTWARSCFNIKTLLIKDRDSCYKDKMVVRLVLSYIGIPIQIRQHLFIEMGTWLFCRSWPMREDITYVMSSLIGQILAKTWITEPLLKTFLEELEMKSCEHTWFYEHNLFGLINNYN